MTKEKIKKIKDIQKALDDFPRIVMQKKNMHKANQKRIKSFEPLVKDLLKRLKKVEKN